MDMIRRKFSASSPTKSWTDLGSSGGAASLGRTRTRSRSSVSILDQKIILSGISGDEESSDSSSSSEGTSSSSPIRTESAPGTRRSLRPRRSASSSDVSEQLEPSGVSVVPSVPSASSVQTETAPTATSLETERVAEAIVQTEKSPRESIRTESKSTLKSVRMASANAKRTRPVRSARSGVKSESKSGSVSESDSDSCSELEPSVVAVGGGLAAGSNKLAVAAARGGSPRDREKPASSALVRSRRKETDQDNAWDDRGAAKRQETRHQDKTERSARRASKRHSVSARRDSSLDDCPKSSLLHHDDTRVRDRDRRQKRTSKHDTRPECGSRAHRHSKPTLALERPGGTELGSPERHRSRRARDRELNASWPEMEWDRTDASESLVVSYQRRMARSSGGCRHCRRQAWPPPPPVTVVVPPTPLGAGAVGDAVRLAMTAGSTVFVDGGDEDAVLSTILAQQIVLTRHFLASQQHMHRMYRRALRQTQRQVYTHREDLKVVGRRRRRGGTPSD